MIERREFQPEWVSPPGDTIADLLEERAWTQAELADRTGYSKKFINQLIKGKVGLTGEAALKLESVFGAPARFWMTREAQYREDLERKKAIEAFESEKNWLRTIPYRFMVNAGWIADRAKTGERVAELLRYFRVASPSEWRKVHGEPQGAWRRSAANKSDPGAVAAWVRQGELEAEKLECAPYNKERFKDALTKIAAITAEDPGSYGSKIVELCASAGVAVVFVPKVPKAGVSGLTKWLGKDRALIQLSLLGKYEDRFWFTFFHEAGHILLHGKKLVFLENDSYDSPEEKAADRFAADILIPPEAYKRFLLNASFNKSAILKFSKEIGLAPGIVVGRLQHDNKIPFRSLLNDLKKCLEIHPEDAEQTAGNGR